MNNVVVDDGVPSEEEDERKRRRAVFKKAGEYIYNIYVCVCVCFWVGRWLMDG